MSSANKRIHLVSLALVAVMLWQYGGGRTYAALRRAQLQPPPASEPKSALPNRLAESRFDALLAELREVIRDGGAGTTAAPEKGFAGIERLRAIKDQLAAEDEKNQKYFIEQILVEKKLPAEIRERQAEFVRQYQSKYDALTAQLQTIESAHKMATGLWGKLTGQNQSVDWTQVLDKSKAFLEANTPKPRQSFDPHNLPHRSLEAEQPIAPKLTREEWLKAFPKEATSSGPTLGGASVKGSSTKAGNGVSPLATLPPTPADLAETIEVKFTPEIRQLADSLDHNPVKIHNWVRNNIDFVPTWGSIQGAQLCLETKSCNAFDTSSLVISLLRYSGIPARYQMGTITVPINKVMNWLGGVTDPRAAALLLSSGGVPSEVITNQGIFLRVRMEHAWVKAFVDYVPSGGAVNEQADTWVEIDASFKQYAVVEGLDLSRQVAFDHAQYLSSPSTVSPMGFYLQQVQEYLSNNLPGRTLDDVLRKESIIRREYPILGAALPYTLGIKGPEFSIIPDALRQTIKFEAFSDPALHDLDFSYTTSLPELAGKRVTLSYSPTDPAVARSFEGMYLAPPYLLRLKPILMVNGAIRAQGQTSGRLMGETQLFSISLSLAGSANEVLENEITVGSYQAIVLNPEKVTQAALNKTSYDQIVAEDERLYGTLNLDNSDRDALYGAVLNWLGLLYFQRLDQVKQQAAAIYKIRNLNRVYLGMFAFDLTVRALFGRPAAIAINRLTMDVDRIVDAPVSVRGDQAAGREVTILTGFHSSFLEHSIFDLDVLANGFSAVKALQQARATGIPIFDIDANNANAILPQLNIAAEIKDSILDHVNRGRIITIPQREVTIGALRGVGYAIIDPQTGDGSYLISTPQVLAGGETEYFVHGLSGWQQNLPVYGPFLGPESFPDPCQNGNRPVGIVIMGNGGGSGIGDWLAGLSRGSLNQVARILHGANYEVAASRVGSKDAFTSVIRMVNGFRFQLDSQCQPRIGSNGQPIKRANLFIYIGHAVVEASNPADLGILSLNPGSSDPISERFIHPSDVSAVRDAFRFVYLSGCNTGLAKDSWAGSFGADLLLGHDGNIPVSVATGNSEELGYASCAVTHLMTGGTGADAMSCLQRSPYFRGDRTVTVMPCNVCSLNPSPSPSP